MEHPTALIQRAMQIGKSLNDGSVSAESATFLVGARDLLNVRAAPATGSSIVFTLLVISKIHPSAAGKGPTANRSHFIYTNEHLEAAASKLAIFVRRALWGMAVLLAFTLALSAYVAWGKLLLDTRDAALRDFGANQSVFAAQLAQASQAARDTPTTPRPAASEKEDLISALCKADHRSFVVDQACKQHDELLERIEGVAAHIQSWDVFPQEFEGWCRAARSSRCRCCRKLSATCPIRCPGFDGFYATSVQQALGRKAFDAARSPCRPHPGDARGYDWSLHWTVFQQFRWSGAGDWSGRRSRDPLGISDCLPCRLWC